MDKCQSLSKCGRCGNKGCKDNPLYYSGASGIDKQYKLPTHYIHIFIGKHPGGTLQMYYLIRRTRIHQNYLNAIIDKRGFEQLTFFGSFEVTAEWGPKEIVGHTDFDNMGTIINLDERS